MEFSGDSLDDVLIGLYNELSRTTRRNEEAGRGANYELLGVSLRISDPRARLSRSENRGKTFSAIGELLWYMSGRDDLWFIKPYVPIYKKDVVDGIIQGAYGPRLFNMRGINQLDSITSLLTRKPRSRRAVIQLFNAEDIAVDKKEIPCTTTLQFHLRDDGLHLSVTMRSNDAYWGLPHDVFCFTMIQEIIANKLDVPLGSYMHYAGSMHVYDDFVEEMPGGDNFLLMPTVLSAEDNIRHGEAVSLKSTLPAYWDDVLILIRAYWSSGRSDALDELIGNLHNKMYSPYIEGRKHMPTRKPLKR